MNFKRFWPLILLLFVGVLWARSSDIWSLHGRTYLKTTDVIRLTDSATPDVELYNGDLYLKGAESQPSTTAGTYPGLKLYIKNCGGVAWVQGNLITVNDSAVGCGQASPATLDLTDWVGIAEGAVAVGGSGYITVGGYALALTTGAVNRGDTLVSTNSVAGYLGTDTTPTTGADVAVALASGTAAGGLIPVRLR